MKLKAGIAGSTGYTGGELIRLLLHHPQVELQLAYSRSAAGKKVYDIHRDLIGETELHFSAEISPDLDVLFLCMGHGNSADFLDEAAPGSATRIIDLSSDFRPGSGAATGFIYGLPELTRTEIQGACSGRHNIANPGCFATAITLALLPLAAAGVLHGDVHTTAITGSTGAGRACSEHTHFSRRSANAQAYKVLRHQHLPEIRAALCSVQQDFCAGIHFVPWRGAFTRGIIACTYTDCTLGAEQVGQLYRNYYRTHPFVHIVTESPDVKQVVNTNKALLHLDKQGDKLIITSVIDNLLKGASGQAVQNMNLMFGLEECAGLNLKAGVF